MTESTAKKQKLTALPHELLKLNGPEPDFHQEAGL